MNYINVSDVDAYFGINWSGNEDPERCVKLANLWLSKQGLPDLTPIPQEWKDAGCEIAFEIAKGNIYADKQTGLLSKSASAEGVSFSKTFSSNATSFSKGELIALDLLKPWLSNLGSVQLIKKV